MNNKLFLAMSGLIILIMSSCMYPPAGNCGGYQYGYQQPQYGQQRRPMGYPPQYGGYPPQRGVVAPAVRYGPPHVPPPGVRQRLVYAGPGRIDYSR